MKDFFKNDAIQTQMRNAAASARARLKERKPINQISPGDCFLLPETDDFPVRWAAIQPHKDDPTLWYFLAADEYQKIGTCDVELAEADPLSRLVVRCNVGFWAFQNDIDLERFVGNFDEQTVAETRNRLCEMVRGEVPVTRHGIVAEADEEYDEWILRLLDAVSQIEKRLQSEPILLNRPIFDTTYVDYAIVAERSAAQDYRLAADAIGESAQRSEIPPAVQLDSSMPGRLLLQKVGLEFDLVYFPVASDDIPPRIVSSIGVKVSDGKWTCGPDGVFTWTQPLVSIEGKVTFVLGGQPYCVVVS